MLTFQYAWQFTYLPEHDSIWNRFLASAVNLIRIWIWFKLDWQRGALATKMIHRIRYHWYWKMFNAFQKICILTGSGTVQFWKATTQTKFYQSGPNNLHANIYICLVTLTPFWLYHVTDDMTWLFRLPAYWLIRLTTLWWNIYSAFKHI